MEVQDLKSLKPRIGENLKISKEFKDKVEQAASLARRHRKLTTAALSSGKISPEAKAHLKEAVGDNNQVVTNLVLANVLAINLASRAVSESANNA